jgi:hypothetical protein
VLQHVYVAHEIILAKQAISYQTVIHRQFAGAHTVWNPNCCKHNEKINEYLCSFDSIACGCGRPEVKLWTYTDFGRGIWFQWIASFIEARRGTISSRPETRKTEPRRSNPPLRAAPRCRIRISCYLAWKSSGYDRFGFRGAAQRTVRTGFTA